MATGAYATTYLRNRKAADEQRLYLRDHWRESAGVRFARSTGDSCRILSNNTALLMIHRERGLLYRMPSKERALRRVFRDEGATCIVLFHAGFTGSITSQLDAHHALVETLAQEGAIALVESDALSQVWVSRRGQPAP